MHSLWKNCGINSKHDYCPTARYIGSTLGCFVCDHYCGLCGIHFRCTTTHDVSGTVIVVDDLFSIRGLRFQQKPQHVGGDSIRHDSVMV